MGRYDWQGNPEEQIKKCEAKVEELEEQLKRKRDALSQLDAVLNNESLDESARIQEAKRLVNYGRMDPEF